MENKDFIQKFQLSVFQLYYYLFYDYNTSKIKAFILVLLDIFQLFSINLNERVIIIFITYRIHIFGMMIQKYFVIL